MSKWIFFEDYKVKNNLHMGVNLAFVVNISLRIDDAEVVFFTAGGGHAEPHVMTFQSKEICQKTYDDLKAMLRTEK